MTCVVHAASSCPRRLCAALLGSIGAFCVRERSVSQTYALFSCFPEIEENIENTKAITLHRPCGCFGLGSSSTEDSFSASVFAARGGSNTNLPQLPLAYDFQQYFFGGVRRRILQAVRVVFRRASLFPPPLLRRVKLEVPFPNRPFAFCSPLCLLSCVLLSGMWRAPAAVGPVVGSASSPCLPGMSFLSKLS